MKKFLTLLFGLIIASLAVYAIPKELDKVKLKDVIKIEIGYDAVAPIVSPDIQIDVDDGVAVDNHVFIKGAIEELELEYVVMDEGKPMAGHRRWFSPGNLQHFIDKPADDDSAARANKGELNTPPLFKYQTPIGLFDKNRCSETRLSMLRSSPPTIGSSRPISLIE